MRPNSVPISAWLVAILLGAALAAGSGCSTTNSDSVVLSPQGTHPQGWATAHGSFARPDGASCAQCHGSATDNTASGGIARVSCFSGPRGAQWCHANGPAFHPADWLDKGGAHFHGALTGVPINGKSCSTCHTQSDPPSYVCLNCHFDPNGGRVPPGSAWTHGDVGGHAAFGQLDVVNAVNAVCIRCHEINNAFGHMPQPFCHNCHSPAPAGFHPTGWANPDSHGAAAKLGPGAGTTGFQNCRGCHGANLDGVGGSAPSCVNNTACHGYSADNTALGANLAPHSPRPWTEVFAPGGRTHTTTSSDSTNAAVCALCHFGGDIHSPTPPPGGSTPGCFNNTLCHGAAGAPHPVRPYATHPADAANFDTVCDICHSISPPRQTANAPSCTECHKGGSPLTFTSCTSCHAAPPNGAAPVGSVFPNIAGAHAKHNALAGVTGICNACHSGGGTGTGLKHFYDNTAGQSGIDVALADTTYQAQGAVFAFNADNTCANVSCHGGIATPTWQTGTISTLTNAGCRLCHKAATQGTVQYNDVTNNVFTFHVFHAFSGSVPTGSLNFACTVCHDTAALTQSRHFGELGIAGLPAGAANATILSALTWNPTPPITKGSCLGAAGCHN